MFEIIPNWHPIFVHFAVALLSLAVGLFVVTSFVKGPLKEQWAIVARWSLWFGAGFTIITGLSGLYAYNTVAHDTPSHAAMSDHRNWAIVTITAFLALAAWSIIRIRAARHLGMVFVGLLALAGVLLASTAWRGGEVVYRYGLGVMSLPKADAHHHGEGEEHDQDNGHSHSDGDHRQDGAMEMNRGVSESDKEMNAHDGGEYDADHTH